ncbi:MAG: flagellin [Pseudomonadota bacterium]
MAMVINTNVMSLTSQRSLMNTQSALSTSMERLSTGLRINSAKDDAAGLGITDRMTSQIRGLNQAIRNANDAISLSQTAEGAMQESTNILQRMRELAVQSANDSNSASDRANLQKEVNQLQQELDRIVDTTTFNGKALLDGSFTSAQFQVGANANEIIDVSIGNISSTAIGNNTVPTDDVTGTLNDAVQVAANTNGVIAGGTLTLNGAFGTGTADYSIGASAKEITAAVNTQTEDSGVSAEAVSYALLDTLSADDTISFTLTGSDSVNVSASITQGDVSALADAINATSGQSGITASLTDTKDGIILKSSSGEDIAITGFTSGLGTSTMAFNSIDATGDPANAGATAVTVNDTNDFGTVGGTVTFNSVKSFSVDDSGAQLLAATTGSALSSVSDIDISDAVGSNNAISILDGALASVSAVRADLGAIQNRMNSTITNLSSISENVSAARSRVQDADFAAETANLTRAQILQQAGVAMLSQANAQPQMVLQLLQ